MTIKSIFTISALLLLVMFSTAVYAEDAGSQKSPYLVVEGKVTQITARMLIISGQQYPVSKFVRVFHGDEKGQEMPMHTLVSIGKIDKARLYILKGKVERIIAVKDI